jgi:hypothetical protein
MKALSNTRVVHTHRYAAVHAIKFDNADIADGLPEANQESVEK